jgi:hypothetical protein
VFALEPDNYFWRKIATIEGTNLKYITKIKHMNQCNAKYLESCWGWYCTKFYEYDCIAGTESTVWRRDKDSPPEDENDGEDTCPGH